jgi:hypothetical protein
MFKRWIPASFIAVAMALALAGGAVLAAGGAKDLRQSDVFERAAQILGIDPADLHSAHDEANREEQDARLAEIVEKLVATGVIEQSEADSFNAWLAVRPEAANDDLFNRVTSSLLGSPPGTHGPIKIRKHFRIDGDGTVDRMAEILELDQQELADALRNGEDELEELDRLTALHAAIDGLFEKEAITAEEAAELHEWIDAMPRWLLDLDISSRLSPEFGFFADKFGKFDRRKGFPFGGDHFGRGKREFKFKFRGPKGTFRFGPGEFEPGEHDFPFDEERFQEFFERFDFDQFEGLNDLENFERFDELLEGFNGYHHFNPSFIDPPEPTEVPDNTATSA